MHIYQKGEGWDLFNSLTVPYFCVSPKPDPSSTFVIVLYLFIELAVWQRK